MDQYTILLIIGLSLLVGVIGTLKLLPYFTKQALNENQTVLLLQAKKFAQEVIAELKLQFGNDYVEQRENIIELIYTKFEGKIDRKIVELIVDYALKGLDFVVANYDVKINIE